jgi:hypothetical protein
MYKHNKSLTSPGNAANFDISGAKPISVATIKIRLFEVDLYGRVAVKKSFLRAINKKKRLDWAQKHQH